MGRPRKFEEEDVVAAVSDVFADRGFEGTTMDDLMRASGLGKQSLYNTFTGKRELFLRALSTQADHSQAAAGRSLAADDRSPIDRIRDHLLELAVDYAESGGQLLTKAAAEMAHRDLAVAESSLRGFKMLKEHYSYCLEAAVSAGELRTDLSVDELASFFLALTRGMSVLGMAGVDRDELISIGRTAVDLILPEERG